MILNKSSDILKILSDISVHIYIYILMKSSPDDQTINLMIQNKLSDILQNHQQCLMGRCLFVNTPCKHAITCLNWAWTGLIGPVLAQLRHVMACLLGCKWEVGSNWNHWIHLHMCSGGRQWDGNRCWATSKWLLHPFSPLPPQTVRSFADNKRSHHLGTAYM